MTELLCQRASAGPPHGLKHKSWVCVQPIIIHKKSSWPESTWRTEVPRWDWLFLFVSLGGWHICAERQTEEAGQAGTAEGRRAESLGRSAQHRFPVARTFIPAITWFLFSFWLSFFEDLFCLSLILQFRSPLNAKRNLILQALCDDYVPSAGQTLFLKPCALCTNKSFVVIDSKVFYLM